jgi:hypothetical protein
MSWYLAPALTRLRAEIDERWPHRHKVSDGSIGDARHAATISDHNPDGRGCVHAIDITHDPAGPTGDQLVKLLLAHPDVRLAYVIWNRHIWSRTHTWAQQPYTGPSPHTEHVHISMRHGASLENDQRRWLEPVPPKPQGPPPAPKPHVTLWRVQRAFRLRNDDENNDTEQVQRALNAVYKPTPPLRTDGLVDDATFAAYKAHQVKLYGRGPDADGIPGRDSLQRLGFVVDG